MSFIDTLAHEYGWSIEYIMSLPYAVVPGLTKAIAERHNRTLAELILCIHPKDPQEVFSRLVGGSSTEGKSLDEIRSALAGVVPIEVRKRGDRRDYRKP